MHQDSSCSHSTTHQDPSCIHIQLYALGLSSACPQYYAPGLSLHPQHYAPGLVLRPWHQVAILRPKANFTVTPPPPHTYDAVSRYTPAFGRMPPSSVLANLGLLTFPSASGSLNFSAATAMTTPSNSNPIISATVDDAKAAAPLIAFPRCPAIPPKLVQKILAWEYVDLGTLLPEQLHSAASTSSSAIVILPESTYETHKRKKRQIPDIATWVQVYSIYMLILASKYPDSITELIAYQLMIVQHSAKFEYPSWLHYDTDFRQWAAANKYTTWSQIHPQFYTFTAHGKGASWCPMCHMDGNNHTYDYPKFGPTPTQPPTRKFPLPPLATPKPLPSPPLVTPNPLQPGGSMGARLGPPVGKRSRPEHCILYNKYRGTCPYGDNCKYTHRCAYCSQMGHPVAACPSKQ